MHPGEEIVPQDGNAIAGIEEIRETASLVAFLRAGRWRRRFSDVALAKARDYTSPQRLREIRVFSDEEGSVWIEAVFASGSDSPYRTSAVFAKRARSREGWTLMTSCTCRAGEWCPHAAAALIAVQREVEDPDERSGAGSDAAAGVGLGDDEWDSRRLHDWLRQIRESVGAESPAPGESGPQPSRFLAYCLHPPHHDELPDCFRMALHVGRRNKNGSITIQFGPRARADPERPSNYMVREDVFVAFRYHQYRRGADEDEGPPVLRGAEAGRLLSAALATGRLFLVPTEPGEAPLRLTAGPPVPASLGWREGSRGAQPALEVPGNRVVIPVDPPMALDAENGTVAPLDGGDLPTEVLTAWLHGPVIPPALVDEAVTGLAGVPARAPLPAPRKVESRTVAGAAPSPVLTVRRVPVKDPFGNDEDLVLGEIGFTYGDSPLLTPLDAEDPEVTSFVADGVRWVIHRSFQAERALRGRLRIVGFRPLDVMVAWVFDLPKEAKHSVVPSEPFPTPEAAWLLFLHHGGADSLRAEGWTITGDAGFPVRDVEEFVTDFESESGVDWFRFDAGFEIDGRRVSLIPILADVFASGGDIPDPEDPELPESFILPDPEGGEGFLRVPARRFAELVQAVRHLFLDRPDADGPLRLHRLQAADLADSLGLDNSATNRSLRKLGRALRDFKELPTPPVPATLQASLRPYQMEGFHWLQFLARHQLHGILADDMGLGKTMQTLAHLLAESAAAGAGEDGKPSLVVAPTSVVPNWASEAERFAPTLKTLVLHGPERYALFDLVPQADLVITSYALLTRDFDTLGAFPWRTVVLDEAQHVKNPRAKTSVLVCRLEADQRICLSGTPVENHLGELWSLMRFLMPGYLGDADTFRRVFRTPIEKHGDPEAQAALNRRVAPLLVRRTKDEVAKDLPAKSEIVHRIPLGRKQSDLYESVRAAMDKRVRDAMAARGLAKSHIIVLDALLKLRQICCHPKLLKTPAARKVGESAKLDHLTRELLPTLLEDGRRILLFSQFTSMLALIEEHLTTEAIPFVKLIGSTRDRTTPVRAFQNGDVPLFLISLKAGGTGLNLTAADTVIHYDPWWNPAAENQATDRAHRIGQDKPVFVHKLICEGTIEERIHELQSRKSALVEALLDESTTRLRIDRDTLENLLAPIES